MSGTAQEDILQEVLPKSGLVVSEKGNLTEALCKPKILPLKSITLQKLEEMEAKAAEVAKTQGAGVNVTDTMAAFAAAARKEDRS